MSSQLSLQAPQLPTGFLAPAMRLMGRFMFPAKALVISLVFLAPLTYLMFNLYQVQSSQIAFTQHERHGVRVMAALQPVMHGLLDVRNATRAGLAGGTLDTRSEYSAARLRVDAGLKSLEAAVSQHEDPLGLRADVEKLKAAFDATASSKSGVDEKGRTVFGPVTAAGVELLQRLGDRSNLVLDPDLDSFYLVNALVLTLPKAVEDLGQLWGWSTFAVQKGALEVADERRFAVWDAGAYTGLKTASEHFGRAITYNPALKTDLDLSGLGRAIAFREKVKSVDALIASDVTPERAYADGKAAVEAAMGVYQSGLGALDHLLQERQNRLQTILWYSLASVVAAILLAVYLFYAFYRVMHLGLSTVEGHLGELANGDLRRRPAAPWARDETSVLISHLVGTYDSLCELISKVRHVSGQLNAASHEIAAASTDLASRTATSASALEQQANSMGDIGAVVGNTAQTAQQAAEFSGRNATVANQAGDTISHVVTTMQGIHTASAKINDIIGVIDGIAFQTNILALNAAVEAARAGDAGRGFAVVASEVRSLAQRSAEAAKEIKALISGSVEKIDQGTQVVQTAGQIMVDVVTNARQVNDLLGHIARSSKEQADGVKEAAHAIQDLDRNTQQNAALVEETNAAALALRAQADNLNEEIQRFRVA